MGCFIFSPTIAALINISKIDIVIEDIRASKTLDKLLFFSTSNCLDFIFDNLNKNTNHKKIKDWLDFIKAVNLEPELISGNIFFSLIKRISDRPGVIDDLNTKTTVVCWCLEQQKFALKEFKLLAKSDISSILLNNVVLSLIVADKIPTDKLVTLGIFFLQMYNRTLFNLVYGELVRSDTDMHELNEFQTEIHALQRYPTHVASKLNAIMMQLRCGFNNISHAPDNAATFILAASRANKQKSYQFLPTILDCRDFDRYLAVINSIPHPAYEHFILSGTHWTAGAVEITDNTVRIFLSDSLGYHEGPNAFWFSKQIEEIDFHRIFTSKSIEIYYAENARQKDSLSCNVYALDDVRLMYTCMRYIPEDLMSNSTQAACGTTQNNLFSFFRANRKKPTKIAAMNVYFCEPPASFLRTTQSSQLLSTFPADNNHIINKAGQTFLDSFASKFTLNDEGKSQNRRIEYKFEKMIARLDKYILRLLADDPEQGFKLLCELAHEHTLDGLKATTGYNRFHAGSGLLSGTANHNSSY